MADDYVKNVKERFPQKIVLDELNRLKGLKVLVIGDSIIDEYVFTKPKGRAVKDPILSLDFIRSERYPGGIMAIANHISNFVDNLSMITLVGDYNSNKKFIRKTLNKKIKIKFFTKKNSPTCVKKRYIDYLRGGKLMKVEYINDENIDKKTEQKIVSYLRKELPRYDLVIVGDFGHGFITAGVVKALEKYSKSLSANIQTNSSNMGFNYITKFSRLDYLGSNEQEVRLAMGERFADLEVLLHNLKKRTRFRNILLTRGMFGCMYISDSQKIYTGPALTNDIKDVIGAGDAVFAVTSLLNHIKADGDMIIFLANVIGGVAVSTMGNKKDISKRRIMGFIGGLDGLGAV